MLHLRVLRGTPSSALKNYSWQIGEKSYERSGIIVGPVVSKANSLLVVGIRPRDVIGLKICPKFYFTISLRGGD